MIIDSHAHISHSRFDQRFRYLSMTSPEGELLEGTRGDMLGEASDAGIVAIIEPAIEMETNPVLLELARERKGYMYPAVGLHPTRTWAVKWRDRKLLDGYADTDGVVAVGETGLDFNLPRREQHRLVQYRFFRYQIMLAHRKGLPLILHIRKADREALRVLRMHRGKLCGGVVHCYWGDWETAQKYLELGFHFGIGGALLQEGPRSDALRDAVSRMPLDRIIVETDSPFVMPDCPALSSVKKTKKIRNSSLILPEVIGRIAEIKGLCRSEVEDAVYRNTLELFGIPDKG